MHLSIHWFLLALLSFPLLQCSSLKESETTEELLIEKPAEENEQLAAKINGVSFVSSPHPVDSHSMSLPKSKVNASWLCFMPFAFVREGDTNLFYNSKRQWLGERKVGIQQMIQDAQKQKYQVMLKPQVWKSHGSFTGHHRYESNSDWRAFEKAYTTYIVDFARMADSMEVALFCIGTEWEQFVSERPNYWKELIEKVRSVYSGKITYAANWDEYKRFPHWADLDYIGLDAYFPLIDSEKPKIEQLKKGWQSHKKQIQHFSDSLSKSILFTEFGYRSRSNNTHKPWESDRAGEVNLQAQVDAYEVIFQEFWNAPNFAGGFLWKWFPNYTEVGGHENNDFTPQGKPAEQVISKYYKLNSGN